MSHKIITIARQFGSGGHEVAQRLSDQLGIPLYDGIWWRWPLKGWDILL